MADQWEQAAKQFKPDPNTPKPSASTGNEDWKVWQQGGGTAAPASAPIGEQPLSPGGLARTMLETGKGAAKELGSTAYNLATGPAAGPLGMAAGYAGRKLGITPKVEAATEPSNTSQQIGKYGAMAGEMLAPIPKALKILPSTEHAGEGLNAVMNTVGRSTPVDISGTAPSAIRAQELRNASFARPPVLRNVLDRLAPGAEPTTFRESSDLATAAGKLSANETARLKGPMFGQVSALAKSLREANQGAADAAGVGDLYRNSINEYRQAKKLEGIADTAGELAKKTATRYVLGGVGLGAGYGIYRHLAGE